jgi:NAD(P)-dependent dehydrogenase (short-subunit alcohol dehydrogenase family)
MGAFNVSAKTKIVSSDVLDPAAMEKKVAMSPAVKRVAMITGAAGGLGSAVARLLAERGHDLALVDLPGSGLSAVQKELQELGSKVELLPADLAQVSDCERVVAEAIRGHGQLDILVNSAAILARAELDDVTAESFDRIFHVNARAPFFLMRTAMRNMAERKWGRIVNITSFGVYQGGERMTSAPYEATKGAVSVFTKMFAKFGAANGILVNSVCPGAMKTQMILEGTPKEILNSICNATPLKRIADPVEVARMVVWLCGEENSFSTGATFDVGGGWGIH